MADPQSQPGKPRPQMFEMDQAPKPAPLRPAAPEAAPLAPPAPPPRPPLVAAPVLIVAEDLPPPPALSAQDAPAPDIGDLPRAAPAAASAARLARGSSLSRLFWWSLGGFASLALSLAAYETIAGLLTRNLWLGRAAMILLGLAVTALLLMAARELAALSRLRKTEDSQISAARALAHRDRPAAERALRDLESLYADRPEAPEIRRRIDERKGDLPDADGLIALAERSWLTAPDAAAKGAVARAARSAAAITAIVPAGLLDAAAILIINLRMIRAVAEAYGGRGGWLGSWRLLKQVAVHLATTGAVAAGEDLLGPILGGGALAKLSRRFGEGLINGALTSRVGVAAMEVCRPLPFHVLDRPSAAAIAGEALRGLTTGRG